MGYEFGLEMLQSLIQQDAQMHSIIIITKQIVITN